MRMLILKVALSFGLPILSWALAVQEANMMAKMRHPNTVLYLGFCPSPPVVVTEFCSRGSLLECIRQVCPHVPVLGMFLP